MCDTGGGLDGPSNNPAKFISIPKIRVAGPAVGVTGIGDSGQPKSHKFKSNSQSKSFKILFPTISNSPNTNPNTPHKIIKIIDTVVAIGVAGRGRGTVVVG